MTSLSQLLAECPGLATREDKPRMSSHALGARNLRLLLRKRFPGREFSVRSSTFANGTSIDVSWLPVDLEEEQAEALRQEVEKTVNLFAYGQYQGMDDSFTYSTGEARAINEALGSAKYVSATPSHVSPEDRARYRAEVMDAQIPVPSARKPRIRRF